MSIMEQAIQSQMEGSENTYLEMVKEIESLQAQNAEYKKLIKEIADDSNGNGYKNTDMLKALIEVSKSHGGWQNCYALNVVIDQIEKAKRSIG